MVSTDMPSKIVLERPALQGLFDALRSQEYQLFGPTVRTDAVVYDQISSVEDLPIGRSDRQDNGAYRLTASDRPSLFDYTVGSTTWKKFLFSPAAPLYATSRDGQKFEISGAVEKPLKRAFIGVRACELQALAIQDRVFTEGPFVDTAYARRRQDLFIVAVNCTRAGGTCFCASMKTGPKASSGFDLALTEVIDGNRHYFVTEVGSEAGEKMISRVPHQDAGKAESQAADRLLERSAAQMGRTLNTDHLKELLDRNFDHPQWGKVADRCLTCANCTLVCPTCFCANIEDATDLTGRDATRTRYWDSCFTIGFSYIHGGSIRNSVLSRYRQWMMHKLNYWVDQFGTFGCVGCGRCITWCPVGIDLTEEARLIREHEKK